MYKKNLFPLLIFLSIVNCYGSNNPQSINIFNNTDEPVAVAFQLPEHTAANIELKKIDLLQNALYQGILNDSEAVIRQAICDGADINLEKNGKSPLLWATHLRKNVALKTLLIFGARMDNRCIDVIKSTHDAKLIHLFIKYGQIDINSLNLDQMPISFESLKAEDATDLFRELANRVSNINLLWKFAFPLAYWHKSKGDEIIRFLLFRNADPNYVLRQSNLMTATPLSEAATNYPNIQIVKILLNAGAKVNQKISYGSTEKTIIEVALIRNRSSDIIQTLLEHETTA